MLRRVLTALADPLFWLDPLKVAALVVLLLIPGLGSNITRVRAVCFISALTLMVVAPAVAIPLYGRNWWRWRTVEKRRRLGLCPNCGYDLRSSADRCPECGEPVGEGAA
jgi:hypothetical protein